MPEGVGRLWYLNPDRREVYVHRREYLSDLEFRHVPYNHVTKEVGNALWKTCVGACMCVWACACLCVCVSVCVCLCVCVCACVRACKSIEVFWMIKWYFPPRRKKCNFSTYVPYTLSLSYSNTWQNVTFHSQIKKYYISLYLSKHTYFSYVRNTFSCFFTSFFHNSKFWSCAINPGGRCRQMVIVKMSVLLSKQVSAMIPGVSHYS